MCSYVYCNNAIHKEPLSLSLERKMCLAGLLTNDLLGLRPMP